MWALKSIIIASVMQSLISAYYRESCQQWLK